MRSPNVIPTNIGVTAHPSPESRVVPDSPAARAALERFKAANAHTTQLIGEKLVARSGGIAGEDGAQPTRHEEPLEDPLTVQEAGGTVAPTPETPERPHPN